VHAARERDLGEAGSGKAELSHRLLGKGNARKALDAIGSA